MGLDVCKICDSEKSGMNHQFPKDHDTALQQTAGDIQNGFYGAEDPGTQDPNLTFETQMLCSQPVLYVNHKQLVQKVCIYVVGDDLGDVGFDFEDLRIRKEMMGVKTESSQMDTKASNGDLDFRAIPHNSKCRYGERGAADAKPKAQIILCVLSSILATQMPCRSRRSGA